MEKITKDTFQEKVLDNEVLVLVDMYADWCGPCKMLSPILEEISKAYPNTEFVKVDVDAEIDVASFYAVQSIPTVLLFKNGEIVEKFNGLKPKTFIQQILDKHS